MPLVGCLELCLYGWRSNTMIPTNQNTVSRQISRPMSDESASLCLKPSDGRLRGGVGSLDPLVDGGNLRVDQLEVELTLSEIYSESDCHKEPVKGTFCLSLVL